MITGLNTKRKNRRLSFMSRALLVVLYLFLLAPQCHSRFYSVANFYRFSTHQNTGQITTVKAEVEHVVHVKVKHLRLDKRFRNTSTYCYHPLNTAGNYPYIYPVVAKRKYFPPFIDLYSSAFLRSRLLRGPPCA